MILALLHRHVDLSSLISDLLLWTILMLTPMLSSSTSRENKIAKK